MFDAAECVIDITGHLYHNEIVFRLHVIHKSKRLCMKRWDFVEMMNAGSKLFGAIHRRKRFANPNHDVHLMARNISEWLTSGVQSIINGTYTPRFLKRIYFEDEMIDQLHLSDRILQNLLLKQLKPTFSHVMNPNCYHLHGPSGVKLATRRVKEALATKRPRYIIRADIKSYYKSIRHSVLLQDIICPQWGGENSSAKNNQSALEQNRMVPHARTLRNARENVKQMVTSGVSLQRITSYLLRWSSWWVQTAECWTRRELLAGFLDVCWDKAAYAIAAGIRCIPIIELKCLVPDRSQEPAVRTY